jgi:hypothetical protein
VLKYATVGCALLCWEGTDRPVPLFYVNNRESYNHGFGSNVHFSVVILCKNST